MSHTNFSQLPVFSLQRKLPTEEPWNVVVGRMLSSSPSCQPHVWLFPVEIISLSAQSRRPPLAAECQRNTSGLGARRTSANPSTFGASVSPSASEGAGLNGLKAHLASLKSAVRWWGERGLQRSA